MIIKSNTRRKVENETFFFFSFGVHTICSKCRNVFTFLLFAGYINYLIYFVIFTIACIKTQGCVLNLDNTFPLFNLFVFFFFSYIISTNERAYVNMFGFFVISRFNGLAVLSFDLLDDLSFIVFIHQNTFIAVAVSLAGYVFSLSGGFEIFLLHLYESSYRWKLQNG